MKRDFFYAYLYAFHSEITGSRFLLSIFFPDGTQSRILIDCGYYQENKYNHLNYFNDINPKSIDAVLVTHSHFDHIGLIPRLVKKGYKDPIYMTEYTKMMVPMYLINSAKNMVNEAGGLENKALYNIKDVKNALDLCEGCGFEQTIEILPGIRVTYFINGHILGSSMLLVECSAPKRKPINFLFTGDYKLTNPFFTVPELPEWLRKKEIILIHESIFGKNPLDEYYFEQQIVNALSKRKNVFILTTAQEKMQENLDKLKRMQENGSIPNNYEIYIDGELAMKTTEMYEKILKTFNPDRSDFIPRGMKKMPPNFTNDCLTPNIPKIIVSTRNIFSNLNPEEYVTVNCEQDSSRHESKENMIDFINSFRKIIFCGINHGSKKSKEEFVETIKQKYPNVKMVDVLNRDYIYNIYQLSYSTDNYYNIKISKMLADLDAISWFKPPKKCEKKRSKKKKRK